MANQQRMGNRQVATPPSIVFHTEYPIAQKIAAPTQVGNIVGGPSLVLLLVLSIGLFALGRK